MMLFLNRAVSRAHLPAFVVMLSLSLLCFPAQAQLLDDGSGGLGGLGGGGLGGGGLGGGGLGGGGLGGGGLGGGGLGGGGTGGGGTGGGTTGGTGGGVGSSVQEAFPPANCSTGGVISWNQATGTTSCHSMPLDCFGGIYYSKILSGTGGITTSNNFGNPIIRPGGSGDRSPQFQDYDAEYANNPQQCPFGYTAFMIGDAMCGDSGLQNESEATNSSCSAILCIGSCLERPAGGTRPSSYAWFIESAWGQSSSVPGSGYDAGTDQRCMGKYVETASACDPVTCTRQRQYLCDADYKEYRTVNCRTTTDGKGLITADQNCIDSITARDDYGSEGFRRRTCVAPIPGGQAGGSTCRCEHGINYSNEGWSGPCPPSSPVTEACTDSPFCQACPSQRITWSDGNPGGNVCSAMSGNITANTTTTVVNTEPGYTGQVQARCFGGTVTTMMPATCTPDAPVGCNSITVQWSDGSTGGTSCQAPTGALPHDPSNPVQIFDNETSTTPNTGSVYVRCDNGVITETTPATCNPPVANCAAQTVYWSNNSTSGSTCSGSSGAVADGAGAVRINNTRSGYTGDIYVECNGGILSESLPANCAPAAAADCSVNWNGDWNSSGRDPFGPCGGNFNGTIASGGSGTVTNSIAGYTGSISIDCIDGNTNNWSVNDASATCNSTAVPDCNVNWSGTWDQGRKDTGGPCSGSYNGTIPNGSSRSAANSAAGYDGSISIDCLDGNSNSWAVNGSSGVCTAQAPTSCNAPADVSWSQGAVPGSRDCYASSFSPSTNPVPDGNSINATNTNAGYTGTIRLTCDAGNGQFVASNVTCSQNSVNGQCGSANGGSYASYPSSNHCTGGTEVATDTTGSDGTYNWRCDGSGGGSNASCSASKTSPAVNGQCGSANGGSYASYPSSNHCTGGTEVATDTTGSDGTYNWRCDGSGGGSNASCSASKTPSGGASCTGPWVRYWGPERRDGDGNPYKCNNSDTPRGGTIAHGATILFFSDMDRSECAGRGSGPRIICHYEGEAEFKCDNGVLSSTPEPGNTCHRLND